MGHAVEPLVDRPGDVALARHADLGEALQAALQFGQLGGLGLGLPPPPAHMHGQGDCQRDQRQDREAGQRQPGEDRVEGDVPHLNGF